MIYYIGTSLSNCLPDILSGKIDEDRVLLITTGTWINNHEELRRVVYRYHNDYCMIGTREDAYNIALKLWETGRLHQPRLVKDGGPFSFGSEHDNTVRSVPYSSLASAYRLPVWIEVFDHNTITNTKVQERWEDLKIYAALVNGE